MTACVAPCLCMGIPCPRAYARAHACMHAIDAAGGVGANCISLAWRLEVQ